MITARDITDAQIEALRDSAAPGDHETIVVCNQALAMKPDKRNSRAVQRSRARCAEILNEREQAGDKRWNDVMPPPGKAMPKATHAFVGYLRCGNASFLEADIGQVLDGDEIAKLLRVGGRVEREPLESVKAVGLCFGCGGCS